MCNNHGKYLEGQVFSKQGHRNENDVALNYCKTITCCTTQKVIKAKVLLGHFMCKIDNSIAKVALDPDGIKA